MAKVDVKWTEVPGTESYEVELKAVPARVVVERWTSDDGRYWEARVTAKGVES